jgi:hypothetical protein
MICTNEGMGYIPSARVLREGDYEAEICPDFQEHGQKILYKVGRKKK